VEGGGRSANRRLGILASFVLAGSPWCPDDVLLLDRFFSMQSVSGTEQQVLHKYPMRGCLCYRWWFVRDGRQRAELGLSPLTPTQMRSKRRAVCEAWWLVEVELTGSLVTKMRKSIVPDNAMITLTAPPL